MTFTKAQKIIAAVFFVVLATALAWLGFMTSALVVVSFITALYFLDLLFNLFLVFQALRPSSDESVGSDHIQLRAWPTFTVLCPMYKETSVLKQFVAAMNRLDYPEASLQILLLLEEDDSETISAAQSLSLPAHYDVVVVPDSQPKTKPKACNYGLQSARGEYVVIFDAEDDPEPDQLKKAAIAFSRLPSRVACLQARLSFYNAEQNWLTRLFTAEYGQWFDIILPGLQRLNGPIPLGGTSNHFRASVLRGLGGWDPYNVTEDCDLGIRLYRQGFRTGMLDSTTFEEANSEYHNWVRQRSRWLKGYLQTLLVHVRGGWDLKRTRDPHFLTFLLVVGGKVGVNFVNPLMWGLTIVYFWLRSSVGDTVDSVYPRPVLYLAVISLVAGNGLFLFSFMLGVARRGKWNLVTSALLAPLYWLMMSRAALTAGRQLLFNPHYWEKTTHGLHLPAADGAKTSGWNAPAIPAAATDGPQLATVNARVPS